jgi:hypothetical protein
LKSDGLETALHVRNGCAILATESRTQMNYPDGTKVMIGDRLMLWEGCYGMVVCSIDDGQYTPEYPEEHWSHLGKGVLIRL